MGKTKVKGGMLHEGMEGFKSLSAALANDAECGCGIVCDPCYSYITLFDYNSTTGEREHKGVWLKDGALVIDTVENIRSEQKALSEL